MNPTLFLKSNKLTAKGVGLSLLNVGKKRVFDGAVVLRRRGYMFLHLSLYLLFIIYVIPVYIIIGNYSLGGEDE